MKGYLLFGFLWLFSSTVYSQTKKDPAVVNYIKAKKEFVALEDSAHLPPVVKPYLSLISDYFSAKGMDKNSFYVWTQFIQDDGKVISIPLCHYDGFKKLKDMEDKDREANKNRKNGELKTVTILNGNASGQDGALEINKATMKVVGFGLWQ